MSSWQSGNETRPRSKTSMVAALASIGRAPIKAKLTARNTLDYVGADGCRRIRLHQTDILTFAKRGNGFTVDTGGWNTPTTRDRLNAHLPDGWQVGTRKGRVYLSHYQLRDGLGILRREELMVPAEFRNRITVSATGKVQSDVKPKTNDKLVKSIDAYMKAWKARGLPSAEDSGGDPWIFTQGKVDEHTMLDWIKSKYVHRRLYTLALAYAGIRTEGVALWLAMADRSGMKAIDYSRIRRYVKACVGLG